MSLRMSGGVGVMTANVAGSEGAAVMAAWASRYQDFGGRARPYIWDRSGGKPRGRVVNPSLAGVEGAA